MVGPTEATRDKPPRVTHCVSRGVGPWPLLCLGFLAREVGRQQLLPGRCQHPAHTERPADASHRRDASPAVGGLVCSAGDGFLLRLNSNIFVGEQAFYFYWGRDLTLSLLEKLVKAENVSFLKRMLCPESKRSVRLS